MCLCSVCAHSVCEGREKQRERHQISKSVLRLCCIWPGSPGQLGYHVMEKIAIFSSGSLTYLSPLTDTPPPTTPTYPLPPFFSHSSPHFLPTFSQCRLNSYAPTMGSSKSPLFPLRASFPITPSPVVIAWTIWTFAMPSIILHFTNASSVWGLRENLHCLCPHHSILKKSTE